MNEQTEQDWSDGEAWIVAALGHDATGGYQVGDVKAEIEAGKAHFWRWPMDHWVPPSAVAVTNFVIYPRAKALNYWLFGGDMASIRSMLPLIEEWGLSQGCTLFMGEGRRGFARAFAKDGYRAAAHLYVKKMPRGRLQ